MSAKRHTRNRRGESGAVMVESAATILVFFLLLFGVVEFAYVFYQWNSATMATERGARLAAVSDPVAGNLRTLTGLEPGNNLPGSTMPSFDCTCNGSTQTCTGTVPTNATACTWDTTNNYSRNAMNTILLANHGTITFGPTLEKAYWNSEIIDAYCKILILAKQIGRVNYFSDQQTKELLQLKQKLGYDDPRLRAGLENCDLCGNSFFDRGYNDAFVPKADAFVRDHAAGAMCGPCASGVDAACSCKSEKASGAGKASTANLDDLVRVVTDQVMAALGSR